MNEKERNRIRFQQQRDQSEEEIIQHLPRIWRRMYIRLEEEGFEKDEVMIILLHFIALSKG